MRSGSGASAAVAAGKTGDDENRATDHEPGRALGQVAGEEARKRVHDRVGGAETDDQQDDSSDGDGESDWQVHRILAAGLIGWREARTQPATLRDGALDPAD